MFLLPRAFQYDLLFKHGRGSRDRFVYNIMGIPVAPGMEYPVGAIRNGNWKLLNFAEDGLSPLLPLNTFELYNLKRDPFEEQNVIADYPEKAQELINEFFAYAATMVPDDSYPLIEEEDFRYIVDDRGILSTNYCNLNGTLNTNG